MCLLRFSIKSLAVGNVVIYVRAYIWQDEGGAGMDRVHFLTRLLQYLTIKQDSST